MKISRPGHTARDGFKYHSGHGKQKVIVCKGTDCTQTYMAKGPPERLAAHLVKCLFVKADLRVKNAADIAVREANKRTDQRALQVIQGSDSEDSLSADDDIAAPEARQVVVHASRQSKSATGKGGGLSIYKGLAGIDIFPKKSKKAKLVALTLEGAKKVECDIAICELFLRHDYPWANIDSDAWKNVIKKLTEVGRGYEGPGRHALSEKLSENLYTQHVIENNKLLAERMPERGITISTDGATVFFEKINNYVANIPGEKHTVPIGMFNGKEATLAGEKKSAKNNALEYKEMAKTLPHGGNYVALVCSDNTGSMSKAWPLIEEYCPTTCCAGDPMHLISLVMDNVAEKCEYVDEVLNDCEELTKYMWSSVAFITLIDEDTTVGTGRMKRPLKSSDMRAIKRYLKAYRIEALKKTFIRIVKSGSYDDVVQAKLGKEKDGDLGWEKANRLRNMVQSVGWWKKLACVLKIVWPLVQILRLGDSTKPTAPHISQSMIRTEKFWAAHSRGTGGAQDVADAILRNLNSDQRRNWDFLKNQRYYLAAMALNPE